MHIGLILIAYLALLVYCTAQVGKRSQARPREDIKKPVLTYALFSSIIYFFSYFISQTEPDIKLFFILNSCMLLAFWSFALFSLFFKYFFDGDSKTFLRDVLVATLSLIALVPVLLWVRTMGAG